MEVFKRGDVVSAHFIFTDTSQTKLRPAVIIAVLAYNDFLLCPITRRSRPGDPYQIEVKKDGLVDGSLAEDSFIRPNLLMCVHRSLFVRKIGSLPQDKLDEVIQKIVSIITA